MPTPASISTTLLEIPVSVPTTVSKTPPLPVDPASAILSPLHAGKSGIKYVHAHSALFENCKDVCGVCEKASSLHTDTWIPGAVEPIARRYIGVTTATPLPSSNIGFRELARSTRAPTSTATTHSSGAKDSASIPATTTTSAIPNG